MIGTPPRGFFLSSSRQPFIKKMDNTNKVLFIIWIVLAVLSFIASFWAPVVTMIIGLVFGGMNLAIIGTWLTATIAAAKEYKKHEL